MRLNTARGPWAHAPHGDRGYVGEVARSFCRGYAFFCFQVYILSEKVSSFVRGRFRERLGCSIDHPEIMHTRSIFHPEKASDAENKC